MKLIQYCSPDQIKIESLEKPVPKDNEVLVKVHATTVNRTDCANLTAKPVIMRFVLGVIKPQKSILGTDFAGEVVSKGKDVRLYEIGDLVFGFTDTGLESQAEFISINEDNVFHVPPTITLHQSAASLEGAHYAYSFVHKAKIQSGQNILINGATGGIGSALLQFVRVHDVHITATCNTKNIELIKSLGADKVYDYTKEDFKKDKNTYDFIFDAVGKSTFGQCKPLLKENGTYISSELGPYAQNVWFSIWLPWTSKKVIFPVPYNMKQTIPFICDHLKKGTFIPVIDREYPLEDISTAYDYVMKGEKTGNVILKINGSR